MNEKLKVIRSINDLSLRMQGKEGNRMGMYFILDIIPPIVILNDADFDEVYGHHTRKFDDEKEIKCVFLYDDDEGAYIVYRESAMELHPDIAEATPETTELEKILCAAIWYKELPREIDARGFQPVNTDVGIVVTGYRHGNCIATVKELSGLRSVKLAPDGVGETKQGFLTNKNRFVDRQEAMIIARKANQLINDDHTDTLFSEDLY